MASENSIWFKLKSAFSGEGFKKAQIECGNVGKAVKSLGPIFGSVTGKFGDFMRGIATGGLWEIGDAIAKAEGTKRMNPWQQKRLDELRNWRDAQDPAKNPFMSSVARRT